MFTACVHEQLHCTDSPPPPPPCPPLQCPSLVCVCCREELNRHLTVVLSILKGCVAYLPMWKGEPATEEGWWVEERWQADGWLAEEGWQMGEGWRAEGDGGRRKGEGWREEVC